MMKIEGLKWNLLNEGIILVDKPVGMTSFGVVARVRRKLSKAMGKKVKVGHTGTLDPFATGLMILLAGVMTKRSSDFLAMDKEYEATVRLGAKSTTGDVEGEITETKGVKMPSLTEIERVIEKFKGEIEQRVPVFSAVKIDGERAYKLARQGRKVEMPTRKVQIYELKIIEYKGRDLKIRCKVSSGTYIRALGEDIGEELGVGGYLTNLRRLRVGEFKVEEAWKLAELGIEN